MKISNAHAEPTTKAQSKSAGFSLVEILVVIAIIGLLVGLLVPSLSYAKTRAKITKTRTLLQAIESGLEMYYNDPNFGGEYPPSVWDDRDPDKTNPWGGRSGFEAYGAQTLVWGLIGPDRKGTLGFKNKDLAGAYKLKPSTNPMVPRADLFFSRADDCVKGMGQLGIHIGGRGNAEVPAIADDFGMPILYFKADLTKPLGDRFDLTDNEGFIFPRRAALHPIGDDQYITKDARDRLNPASAEIDTYFQCFIWNSKIEYSYQPVNSESYLLISAGPDMLYGTGDDITNFPLVGGKNYDDTNFE